MSIISYVLASKVKLEKGYLVNTYKTTVSFTRPADTTAYTAADLVANSTTAGSVVPMQFKTPNGGRIERVRLTKTNTVLTNATFNLYLYESSPTVTNGDNGAFSSTESGFLGVVALNASTSQTTSDKATVVATVSPPIYTTGNIFGLLRAEGTYTPTSGEVFNVTLFLK